MKNATSKEWEDYSESLNQTTWDQALLKVNLSENSQFTEDNLQVKMDVLYSSIERAVETIF